MNLIDALPACWPSVLGNNYELDLITSMPLFSLSEVFTEPTGYALTDRSLRLERSYFGEMVLCTEKMSLTLSPLWYHCYQSKIQSQAEDAWTKPR